jgi:c-di-GMP-binding flagellar brake protein YcgR
VTLQVRNIIDSTTPDNRTSRRVGCAFVGLTPAGETMIQRYVTRLERDRRSRLG